MQLVSFEQECTPAPRSTCQQHWEEPHAVACLIVLCALQAATPAGAKAGAASQDTPKVVSGGRGKVCVLLQQTGARCCSMHDTVSLLDRHLWISSLEMPPCLSWKL